MLNKTYLLTRELKENYELQNHLNNLGAKTEIFPLIEIKRTELSKDDLSMISNVNSFDVIIFSSKNTAEIFLTILKSEGQVYNGKIFCVGKKAKEIVEGFGYKVNFIPKRFSSDGFIETLPTKSILDKKILLPKGNKSLTIIISVLKKFANVYEIVIYENHQPEYSELEIETMKNKLTNKIDCGIFFSPSAVENFVNLFGNKNYPELDFAVIGNTTLSKAAELGIKIDMKPKNATIKDLINEIKKYYLS